jgi:hypothetical protein
MNFLLPIIFILFSSYTAFAQDLILPNPFLTPGDVLIDSTKDKICTPNYTKQIRNVPAEEKKKVFEEYSIDPTSDKFEVDHLISLELGGSNDIKNLWPQSYTTKPWNAHVKDRLENKLHRMICANKIEMTDAQKEISINWIEAYKKYIGDINE